MQADVVVKSGLQTELAPLLEEAVGVRVGSFCLLLMLRINNGYSEVILFIGPDPGQHKSFNVTKAIFYLKSRARQLENKKEIK